MQSTRYEDLIVWQKSMELVTRIYQLTEKFPGHEMYGLTSQMRRAAISIPSNIAEGRRRGTDNEFRHFLLIAFGSGAELETQLRIAFNLGYIDSEQSDISLLSELLDEVMRILNALTSKT